MPLLWRVVVIAALAVFSWAVLIGFIAVSYTIAQVIFNIIVDN